MREIKFRAWDKTLERLLAVGVLDFDEWYLRTSISGGVVGDRHSFKGEETDRFILMQYTGLKDKHGKEIYEGDLLRTSTLRAMKPVDIEMTWADAGFEGRDIATRDEYLVAYGNALQWEVIGNIYENPEQVSTPRAEGDEGETGAGQK